MYGQRQPPEVFCQKNLFLETSQISHENTCIGVFFDKVAALKLATLLKRDSNTDVFL